MLVVPTWDLFITLFFIVGMGYGVILQREKILATLISTYIALAVATTWGDKVFEFFNGNSVLFNQFWIRSNMSEFSIKALLFGLLIVLLTLKGDFSVSIGKAEGMISTLFVFIYSFLNTGLIVESIINFLPQTAKMAIISQSNIASLVMSYDIAWVVLPALLMIVGGFLTSRAGAATGAAPPA